MKGGCPAQIKGVHGAQGVILQEIAVEKRIKR